MKKLFCTLALLGVMFAAAAQNTQEAAAAAAAALSQAEDVPAKVEKPKYWTNTILTNINFGQTWLSQWAAGGYNNASLTLNVDANFKYAKDKLLGANRIQADYGFLYSADKPIVQTNKDRLYLESKWGYETPVRHLAYSASFDFKTQFGNNYNYKAPSDAQKEAAGGNETKAWESAAVLKSGFFAPAYINLGLGALWTPAPWFSLNVAPVSGGVVIVSIPELRNTYGMAKLTEDSYRAYRLELGFQLKADVAVIVNDNFSYTTQFTAFYNYFTPKVEPRLTWDNKVYWKLAKFFALTLSTNLIYDPLVKVREVKDNAGNVTMVKGVQFKEFLEFGFTWSFARQH